MFVIAGNREICGLSHVFSLSHEYLGPDDITFDTKYYADRGCARFHQSRMQPAQDGDPRKLLPANVTYLEDTGADFQVCFVLFVVLVEFVFAHFPPKSIPIYGSPWQPEFCDWAFNLPRMSKELEQKWKAIPKTTQILITHGPVRRERKENMFLVLCRLMEKLGAIAWMALMQDVSC